MKMFLTSYTAGSRNKWQILQHTLHILYYKAGDIGVNVQSTSEQSTSGLT